MKKQESKQRLFEVMQRLDKTFKSRLNENIYKSRDGYFTISEPIIPDAIEAISKHPEAIEFRDKQSFDEFADKQKYFSASYSHCFYSPEEKEEWHRNGNKHNDSDSEQSVMLFNTGHELVQVWDNKNQIGYVVPSKLNNMNETNESTGEYFPITTPVGSEDDKLFVSIVNQGIDSSLEGFTKSDFTVKDTSLGKRRVFNFHTSELPILLRRLEELGTDEALQWKDDIENYDNNINEMSNTNEDKNWFEQELGYLKNNETFTRVELRDILETLYKNVDVSGQYRIMNILQLFGMDEDFK
jgi:hypothetical protein